jgi:hypothetical protein
MNKVKWVIVGAVLVLPLFFQEKLINLNPWGLALVKMQNPHGTPSDFVSQHFGTVVALCVAGFVLFLYALHTDMGYMNSLVFAACVFTAVHWLSFYACGIVTLAVLWAMFRTGAEMTGLAADFVNQQIEIGKQQKYLTVPEFDKEGYIISYRYVFDDGKGPPLSVTANGLSRGGKWEGGFLQAHRIPTMTNSAGIYSCKHPDDPELAYYNDYGRRLVKVKNWGKVVEHKRGYRSQYAQIIEWLS